MPRIDRLLVALLVCLLTLSTYSAEEDVKDVDSDTGAAPTEPAEKPAAGKKPKFGLDTDYGPFLTGSLDRDKAISKKFGGASTEQLGPEKSPNNLAAKAICVDLGGGASVAFDTDLCRYAAGWTGGFVDLSNTHLTGGKGSVPFAPKGEIAFETPVLPGASIDGTFADVREKPFGPLPKEVAHYKGLYRHGRRVVFRYNVGGVDVLDSPSPVLLQRPTEFMRTLRIAPSTKSISFMLRGPDGGKHGQTDHDAGVKIESRADGVFLTLPPHDTPMFITLGPGEGIKLGGMDLDSLTKGGPALWPQTVITNGFRGKNDKPYTVDVLNLPVENPTKSWFRPGGIDFFSDGRLALCSMNGDVWICSGIDDSLKQLTWRRFAAGLYEPLGLKIVKDVVYVLGRDQITRLHDLNADGEADYYENFNNDGIVASNYHSFAFDLQTDPAGNFYYSRAGHRGSPLLAGHGAVMRVSPDGSTMNIFASGFRAANGLGIGPSGELTSGDNQGNWTPACKINLIQKGGFYGYVSSVAGAASRAKTGDFDPPLCWIPMSIDNSGGGQVWSGDKFGPLSNRMFHMSYGKASIMLAFMHETNGSVQGGVIPFPFRFESGVMRGRVSPVDGQLYLAGQRGWQSAGNKDGCLARLRYTGKPLYLPTDCKVVKEGLQLTFSQPVDPETAEDVESYGVSQWNYRWTSAYGSKDYSVRDPEKIGRDDVKVASAKLLPDGKSVLLTIPGLAPVMQMRVQLDLDAKDGEQIQGEIYLTINTLPAD